MKKEGEGGKTYNYQVTQKLIVETLEEQNEKLNAQL